MRADRATTFAAYLTELCQRAARGEGGFQPQEVRFTAGTLQTGLIHDLGSHRMSLKARPWMVECRPRLPWRLAWFVQKGLNTVGGLLIVAAVYYLGLDWFGLGSFDDVARILFLNAMFLLIGSVALWQALGWIVGRLGCQVVVHVDTGTTLGEQTAIGDTTYRRAIWLASGLREALHAALSCRVPLHNWWYEPGRNPPDLSAGALSTVTPDPASRPMPDTTPERTTTGTPG